MALELRVAVERAKAKAAAKATASGAASSAALAKRGGQKKKSAGEELQAKFALSDMNTDLCELAKPTSQN